MASHLFLYMSLEPSLTLLYDTISNPVSRPFVPESLPRPYFRPPVSAGLCYVDEGRGAVGPSEADGLVDAANHPNNKQPANRMGAGCLDDADGKP